MDWYKLLFKEVVNDLILSFGFIYKSCKLDGLAMAGILNPKVDVLKITFQRFNQNSIINS